MKIGIKLLSLFKIVKTSLTYSIKRTIHNGDLRKLNELFFLTWEIPQKNHVKNPQKNLPRTAVHVSATADFVIISNTT